MLEELENRLDGRAPAYSVALVYFAAGDADQGFELLEQAVEASERSVIFMNTSRTLSAFHTDARYIALIERIGLPNPRPASN